MPTRRTFVKGLGLAVGATVLPRGMSVLAKEDAEDGREKDDDRSTVAVYVDVAEKKRSDYIAPPGALPPDQTDLIVFGAVLTGHIAALRMAIRRARKTLPPALRSTAYVRARDASDSFKKTFFKELKKLDDEIDEGLEVFFAHLDMAMIPDRFKDRNGAINQWPLYQAVIIALLASCALSRFDNVYVHPNKRAIRNVSKPAVVNYITATPGVGPANRFEVHPVDPRHHAGVQVADLVTWAHLQALQPHPLPNKDVEWSRIVDEFVEKELDAASLI